MNMNQEQPIQQKSSNLLASRQGTYDIREQVARDLSMKLSEFQDPKKGLKAMSALMGVHEKTLKRLLDCENKPGYQTLLKIYRVLYNTNSDTTVLEIIPNNLADYIKKYKPREEQIGVNVTADVDDQLKKNPVMCEIYCLAGTGGVSGEYVAFHYGKYGQTVLKQMIDQDVLVPLNKYKYILGINQASFTPETIKSISLHLIERFFKTTDSYSIGNNYQAFYAEGLTKEAYQQWLEIDKESFNKKVEIAKNPHNHGELKAFTSLTTDTLSEEQPTSLQ
jgi:hypothetical protein